ATGSPGAVAVCRNASAPRARATGGKTQSSSTGPCCRCWLSANHAVAATATTMAPGRNEDVLVARLAWSPVTVSDFVTACAESPTPTSPIPYRIVTAFGHAYPDRIARRAYPTLSILAGEPGARCDQAGPEQGERYCHRPRCTPRRGYLTGRAARRVSKIAKGMQSGEHPSTLLAVSAMDGVATRSRAPQPPRP